jgi:glycosyltransferase involved in cell wall biosynthesis
MDKLKVGLVIDHYLVKPDLGGTFSYQWTFLKGINEYEFDEQIEIVNICLIPDETFNTILKKPIIHVSGNTAEEPVEKTVSYNFKKQLSFLRQSNFIMEALASFRKRKEQKRIAALKKRLDTEKIDVLFFLTQSGFDIDFPYIINYWDLAHKTTYAFPEIAMQDNYIQREKLFSGLLNKALLILCESEAGRAELKSAYGMFEKKLKLLPMFGNMELGKPVDAPGVLDKFSLVENKFFLYPAQFWTLKNHYNLLRAFNAFVATHPDFKMVFCGSDKGNMKYIKSVMEDLKLNDKVIFAGFVSNDDLTALYQMATAMTFPTFLGPTNMPLLEAARLKCAVLCSNLEGHKEQLGDHALYFEPTRPHEIEAAMNRIADDPVLRITLKEAAYREFSQSKFRLENSLSFLNDILLEAKAIRKTWGSLNSNT